MTTQVECETEIGRVLLLAIAEDDLPVLPRKRLYIRCNFHGHDVLESANSGPFLVCIRKTT
jgi:hypothetical protein